MSTKKIVVFSSRTNSQRTLDYVNTPDIESIRTWGQLKQKIGDLLNAGGMIATMVQTKTSLTNDDSVLAFDQNNAVHIVITPAQVKSGLQVSEDTLKTIIFQLETIKAKIEGIVAAANESKTPEQEMMELAQKLNNG